MYSWDVGSHLSGDACIYIHRYCVPFVTNSIDKNLSELVYLIISSSIRVWILSLSDSVFLLLRWQQIASVHIVAVDLLFFHCNHKVLCKPFYFLSIKYTIMIIGNTDALLPRRQLLDLTLMARVLVIWWVNLAAVSGRQAQVHQSRLMQRHRHRLWRSCLMLDKSRRLMPMARLQMLDVMAMGFVVWWVNLAALSVSHVLRSRPMLRPHLLWRSCLTLTADWNGGMFRRRLQLLTGNGMNILGLPSAQTILSSDPWQHLLLARVREKSLIAFLSKTIHAVVTPPKQSNEAGSKAKFKYQSSEFCSAESCSCVVSLNTFTD